MEKKSNREASLNFNLSHFFWIWLYVKKNSKYNQIYNFWPIDRYWNLPYTSRRYNVDARQGGAPTQHYLSQNACGGMPILTPFYPIDWFILLMAFSCDLEIPGLLSFVLMLPWLSFNCRYLQRFLTALQLNHWTGPYLQNHWFPLPYRFQNIARRSSFFLARRLPF